MALRKFLFMSDEGYFQEQEWTDSAKFRALTMNPAVAGDTVIDVAGGKLVGLPDVTIGAVGNEAVNKNYVDSVVQGLDVKEAVNVVDVANRAILAGLPTIDTYPLQDLNRVLLVAQVTGTQNGIWVAHTALKASLSLGTVSTNLDTVVQATTGGTAGNSLTVATVADGSGTGSITRSGNDFTVHYQSGVTTVSDVEALITGLSGADDLIEVKTAGTGTNVLTAPGDTFSATNLSGGTAGTWTRPVDFNTGAHVSGAFVLTIDGSSSWKGSGWVCTSDAPTDIVDTNSLTFVQFSAASNYTASHGAEIVANDIRVVPGDGIKLTDVTTAAVEVSLTTDAGLQLTGTSPTKTLGAKVNTSAGVGLDANGIKVTLETTNPGLAFGTGGVGVAVVASGGIEKAPTGIQIKKSATDTGLLIDSNGVEVISSPLVQKKFTASGAITKGHCVYISGNNVVSTGSNSADATSHIIGVAAANIADGAQGLIVMHGIVTGVISGTANTNYYLNSDGTLATAASVGAGKRFVLIGYAMNTANLFVDIKDYGKKAAV